MADSAHSYRSKDGDVLDAIVFGHYGDTNTGRVEAVLAANPGLASLGKVLPAGIVVVLPALEEAVPAGTVQLWG